jgi:HSP20 family protein
MTGADPRSWMWAEACAMIARAEQLHRQFFQPPSVTVSAPAWEPPVDVFESDQALMIVAALPGVDSEDIAISLKPGELVVGGVRRLPAAVRSTAIQRLEIPHGRFERRIRLPAARWELERSTLANGCLLVSLAKRP